MTGSHRSGSTWLTNMLALADGTLLVHEPFNIEPWAYSLGGLAKQWFAYAPSLPREAALEAFDVFLERQTRKAFLKNQPQYWLPPLRRRGRLVVVGATALFMGLVIPLSGWPERVVIGLFGSLFLIALHKSFVHIRAKRVALHREWMIRAFAIGLAIATMRLIFVPALLVVADPSYRQITTLSVASFTVAFVLHSSVEEVWIRLTRRSSVPGTRAANAT